MKQFAPWGEDYTLEPGFAASAKCGLCNTEMEVNRGTSKPACMFSKTMIPIDHFFCPNKQERWHMQLRRLWQMHRETPSRSIAKLLEKEIREILATRKPTK